MRKSPFIWAIFDLLTLAVAVAFGPVPDHLAWGDPMSYKVLYIHVPLVWVMFVNLIAGMIFSIAYLRSKNLIWDTRTGRAVFIAVVSGAAGITMGAFWSYAMSGIYWPWEPKSTAVLLLILSYSALLVLRSSISDKEKRANITSVYTIAGVILIPLTFLSTMLFGGTHGYLNQEPVPSSAFLFLGLRAVSCIGLSISLIGGLRK